MIQLFTRQLFTSELTLNSNILALPGCEIHNLQKHKCWTWMLTIHFQIDFCFISILNAIHVWWTNDLSEIFLVTIRSHDNQYTVIVSNCIWFILADRIESLTWFSKFESNFSGVRSLFAKVIFLNYYIELYLIHFHIFPSLKPSFYNMELLSCDITEPLSRM